jgi:toxin FitB
VRWLLDTNVVSESIRPRPNRKVVEWVESRPIDELAISIVTLAELREGAQSGPQEHNRELDDWLEATVIPSFTERTLPLTLPVLIEWIRLNRRLAADRAIRKAADLLIAATARVHGLVVVTRNVRDFVPTGTPIYDPWAGETHNLRYS